MGDKHSHLTLYGKSAIYQLFVSMLILLGVGTILFTALLLAGIQIFNADLSLLEIPSSAVSQKEIGFIRYLLISQDISLFIVPAIIILILMKPVHMVIQADFKIPRINEVLLVIALTFCIFPITGLTGQLNAGMHLPDWLSGVEQWMIEKENYATDLVDMLMTSNTFGVVILNVLMIAVIPAFGEELIFRGVFQKIFCNLFKSDHLAIWITAFVFSAIHFQFFGFLPRFILGLVFGYLFLWSGILWLPIISHLFNNAVPVVGSYIQGWEEVNAPSDIPLWEQMIRLPLPILISIIILLYFRKNSKKKEPTSQNESQHLN